MLNNHPVIYGVLGVSEPQIPTSVPTKKRGDRTFTPLSPEAVGEIGPDVILIVGRSAAIGNGSLDAESLRQALTNGAAADATIKVLTPKLWYLSGGGLQSLNRQIEEVVSAL
ncbi:MAG: hypothetical protein UMU75_09230 [Halomonas sp.]|nr:hypothetical protein [Halomonas sp.]